jgi:hypothetical protein
LTFLCFSDEQRPDGRISITILSRFLTLKQALRHREMVSSVPRKPITQSVPVVQEMSDEISHAMAIQTHIAAARESSWRALGHGLAIILASTTIAWGAGKAFFVPQTDYNAKLQQDMVNAESFRQTMARLDKSITELTIVSGKMNETVQDLKTNIAVIRATR